MFARWTVLLLSSVQEILLNRKFNSFALERLILEQQVIELKIFAVVPQKLAKEYPGLRKERSVTSSLDYLFSKSCKYF